MEISIAPTSPIWIPKSSSSSNSGRRSLNCSSESFVQQPPSPTTNEKTIANIKDLIEKIATSVVSAPNALNGKIQEKAEDIFQTKNEKIDNASEGKQEIESNNNEMDIDEKMHLDWYPQVSEDSTTNDLLSQEEEIQENFRFQSLVEEWENEQYYDERCYDSFFSDEESELQEIAEEFEDRFMNGKRSFKVQRSTKENRKEKHRENKWINARKQRLLEERRTNILSQVGSAKLNSLTDLAINQSVSGGARPLKEIGSSQYFATNKTSPQGKNQEDLDLQKALQISAREYAQQASRHISAPIDARTIADLLSRELTPEDYELLLLLDNDVAPKTVEAHKVNALPKLCFSELKSRNSAEICTICFMDYEQEDEVSNLPCGHVFHHTCITRWLGSNSTRCPVDNMEV